MRRFALTLLAVLALPLLGGCDALGIESTEQVAAKKEAEGKATGSACRHALRAIEDCYTLNPKAVRSAVFAGWREMDEYMRENKIEGIAPVVPRPVKGGALASKADEEAQAEGPDASEDHKASKAEAPHAGKHKGA